MVEFLFIVFLIGLLALLLRRERRRRAIKIAVIDGSNLLYWNGEALSLQPVHDAIEALVAAGYQPCVIFDANAGYLVAGQYLDGARFAKLLGLRAAQAYVVPKGEPADPHILRLARDSGGIVVSRDRFRDWSEEFAPETASDRVVRGGYRRDKLWLDLPKDKVA